MRMWMVPSRILCSPWRDEYGNKRGSHLLGEWHELPFAVGIVNSGRINGFIKANAIEPLSINLRYKELKEEMLRRGYKPKMVLKPIDFSRLSETQMNVRVDRERALKLLIERCPECRRKYEEMRKNEMYDMSYE